MDPRNFGDTPAAAWLAEIIKNVLRELPGGKSGVDMNLLINMCKGEPKHAQMAMQMLAYALKKDLGARPVSTATGLAQTHRLLLGSIFLAYCVSRDMINPIPPELEFILKWHPIVMQCAEFVSADQDLQRSELRRPTKRPWYKFWHKD